MTAARGGRAGTAERARLRQGRAWTLVQRVRPLGVVLFAAAVVVGGVLSAGGDAFAAENLGRLLLASLSAALIGAAAGSLSAAFDLAAGRVDRPDRPLPSGRAAWLLWALGSAAGVLASLWLSAWHVGIALGAVALLYAYHARLRRIVLWGNLAVAFVAGLAFVYGGRAVGPAAPALVGVAFAFLTTLARSMVRDVSVVQEVAGEAGGAAGVAGALARVYGPVLAGRVAGAVLLVVVALTPLPFLFLGYGGLYLLLVLVADVLLLRAWWLLQPPVRPGAAGRLLTGVMAVGLAALACAGVVG